LTQGDFIDTKHTPHKQNTLSTLFAMSCKLWCYTMHVSSQPGTKLRVITHSNRCEILTQGRFIDTSIPLIKQKMLISQQLLSAMKCNFLLYYACIISACTKLCITSTIIGDIDPGRFYRILKHTPHKQNVNSLNNYYFKPWAVTFGAIIMYHLSLHQAMASQVL
jgi:hypothetical protein